MLKDTILLFKVQYKSTNCEVYKLRFGHHYKLRCYSMFIIHLKETKSEFNLFKSPVLCGQMNVPPLLNMTYVFNLHGALVASTVSDFNISL